jgi:hypothetical protein
MVVGASSGGRRQLFFDEVVAAGRPAIFSAYGDHLLYVDGTIYALTRDPDPSELAEPRSFSGAYVVTHTIGTEFGWRHLETCDCPFCADQVTPYAA